MGSGCFVKAKTMDVDERLDSGATKFLTLGWVVCYAEIVKGNTEKLRRRLWEFFRHFLENKKTRPLLLDPI